MITAYVERMPQIIAERRIEAATAASLPFREDAQEAMDSWMNEIDLEVSTPEPATPGMLKLMGMGVEHVG